MDWTDLQVFVETARSGSLAQAGRVLDLSAPTVKRRLDALEIACGFTLFTRTGMTLQLTAVGHRLLKIAAAAQAVGEGAAELARASRLGVSVAAMELITEGILAPAAVKFIDAAPGIAVTLESCRTREALTGSSADIVVLASPIVAGGVCVRLGHIQVGLYAHRDYLATAPRLDRAADLVRHRIIGAENRLATRFILGRLGLPADEIIFSFLADSTLAQVRAMICGGGVTACYSPLARREPGVVQVLPEVSTSHELWIWWPHGRDRPGVDAASSVIADSLQPYLSEPDEGASADVSGPEACVGLG